MTAAVDIGIVATPKFSVWSSLSGVVSSASPPPPKSYDPDHLRVDAFIVDCQGEGNNNTRESERVTLFRRRFSENMEEKGCAILRYPGSVIERVFRPVQRALAPLMRAMMESYNNTDDDFDALFGDVETREKIAVSRYPRIGRGKHNIHFEERSDYHESISNLANQCGFARFLADVSDSVVSLREVGLSATRPFITEPGEGMEWHSDGAEGEYTVLLTLQDLQCNQGCLQVAVSSFLKYNPLTGHGEASEIESSLVTSENCCIASYSYRQGEAMVIDARTLHSVLPNISQEWRFILWFIYDSY